MNNISQEIEDSYATKDLYFAAYLYVKGIEIKKLEKYGPDRSPVYFIFDDKERCLELDSIFWGGEGEESMVNIKQYTSALRDLRIRAFSVTRTVKKSQDSWKGEDQNENNQDLHF